jgi:hypothetical protein
MSATYAEAKASLNLTGAALWDAWKTHMPSMIDDVLASNADYEGDYPDEVQTQYRSLRRTLLAQINGTGPLKAQFDRAHLDMCAATDGPNITVAEASATIPIFQQYQSAKGIFAGNGVSEKVTARNISRGAVSAPTNLPIKRLTVNRWGQELQGGRFESIKIEVANQTLTIPRKVRFIGRAAGQDAVAGNALQFDEAGSGITSTEIDAYDPVSTPRVGGIITNPQLLFGGLTGGASVTTLNGWTTLSGTWTSDTTNVLPNRTTSLKTSVDGCYFEQQFTSSPDQNTPTPPAVWVFVNAAFVANACTITTQFGSHTQVFTGGSEISAGWNLLVADMDKDIWPLNYESATARTLKVTVGINTAGEASFAYAGMCPMSLVLGTWYLAWVGSVLPILGAIGSVTDTETSADAGKIAILQVLLYGATMPLTGTTNIDTIT